MGRIRTIKPEFFRHETLFDLEKETGLPIRVAFAGLFCCCDREGRFEWKPKQLKLDILPWDECDFSRVLDALTTRGFIVRYASEGREFGHIPSWKRHQVLNNREKESDLPGPEHCQVVTDACATREPRVTEITQGKGREGEGKGRGKEGEQEGRVARDVVSLNGKAATARTLLAFLNDKAGRAYQDTTVNLELIVARLKEGYDEDICRAVIVRKCREWGRDDKMAKYLRPATLFNREKFNQYAGECVE